MRRLSAIRFLQAMALVLAAGAALALLLSAAHAPAAVPAQDPRVLAKLDDEWSDVVLAKDPDRIASYYTPDAILYPPGQPLIIGQAAAKKLWADLFADTSYMFNWETLRTGVAKSYDLGFTTGNYEASFQGPSGERVREIGKYVLIWKKQKDGSWKVSQHMWNLDTK